jgi:hypothetical protein
MAELFIVSTCDYFPDKNFSITFTSGFDGRTLVSCARKLGKILIPARLELMGTKMWKFRVKMPGTGDSLSVLFAS